MPNYESASCPVCNNKFSDSDDIVVCPGCGTPYHRECYNSVGHCLYQDKHGADESWYQKNEDLDKKQCPNCGSMNDEHSLVCSKCGKSFIEDESKTEENDLMNLIMDPFGGVNPKEVMMDDVTAEDMVMYVKVNTPYYMNVFKRIKDNVGSRFSFSAFLFSGGWLLYRKQYKIGTIITLIMASLMILSTYVSYRYSNPILQQILSSAGIDQSMGYYTSSQKQAIYAQLETLPMWQSIMLIIPTLVYIIQTVIMMIIGFKANRIYMKDCINKIKIIKEGSKTDNDYKEKILYKGGVDVKIAFFVILNYLVINFLPVLVLSF